MPPLSMQEESGSKLKVDKSDLDLHQETVHFQPYRSSSRPPLCPHAKKLAKAPMTTSSKSPAFPGSFYILAEKDTASLAEKPSPFSKSALNEIYNRRVWIGALLELVGSASLVYVTGTLAIALAQRNNPAYVVVGAVYNWILLTLHIMACAPASGGHLNSAVTISALACGLATPVRAVLYVAAQLTGATAGGALVRAAVGSALSDQYRNAACVYDHSLVSYGSALATEIASLFVLIFIAFGIVLDTRQKAVFGPIFGPNAIGLTVGLGVSITGLLRPGFPSAGLNPSRCFGLAAPIGAFEGHWIQWSATFIVAILIGILHFINHPEDETGFFPS